MTSKKRGSLISRSIASSPPRTGSGTKRHSASATGMPASPISANAQRQLSAVAIQPPKNSPSAEPIGMPSEKIASARARLRGGK